MLLLERAAPLELLKKVFSSSSGEGRCILIGAEAGMGKTSLVKALKEALADDVIWLEGSCDALFTPRPLAPVYDLARQLNGVNLTDLTNAIDRSDFFSNLLMVLEQTRRRLIIVFEDIHWADEATLDFIKFLGRRIHRLPGMLILTYRDNEIHLQHPLRHVLGQMASNSVTRINLSPLTKETVTDLAKASGYDGDALFRISGGNPFYVTEILQNGTDEVPQNVRDSILSSYFKLDQNCQLILQLLSVLPGGLRLSYLAFLQEQERAAIQLASTLHILVVEGNKVAFKHELYRITIESSLSPFTRIDLNKRVLALFGNAMEAEGEIERIVHHAKAANDYEAVVSWAPSAAHKAAELGAHTEAAKLLRTAIDYYQGNDRGVLLQFYEPYAYECYLTNQLKDGVIYAGKALRLLKEGGDIERTVQCINLLVKMWWFEGQSDQSRAAVEEACNMIDHRPPCASKAIALCGRAYLFLLADQISAVLSWGQQALEMAKSIGDDQVRCYALTPVGVALYRNPATRSSGWQKLSESLDIAITRGFHEQVGLIYLLSARADMYCKNYVNARKLLDAAVDYCEHSELLLNTPFLLGLKAWWEMDQGNWTEAKLIGRSLLEVNLSNPLGNVEASCVLARIAMRKGEAGVVELLDSANRCADKMEPFLFVVVASAYLEYEWITGQQIINAPLLQKCISALEDPGCEYPAGDFVFWYWRARGKMLPIATFEGYQVQTPQKAKKAAALWRTLCCPYEEAVALFHGSESDKRAALEILDKLQATAVFEKMKFMMRSEGIRQLPRGLRASTRANAANLTARELDVLGLLREQLGNKEIANRLFLSPKTVDHHISSILFKLDVNSRAKAVREAQRLNILR